MSRQPETEHRGRRVSTDQALIQLLTAAWATQSVAAAAKLGIPEVLADGAKTAEEVAAKTGAHAGATYRLLRGLASLGVFERQADGRFANTAVGDRLRTGVPRGFKDTFIAETDHVHWQSWERLVDAVKTGLPRPKAVFGMPAFDYYGKNRPRASSSASRCRTSPGSPRRPILEAYDFSGVRTIMDVGGGNGSMALAILEKYPK